MKNKSVVKFVILIIVTVLLTLLVCNIFRNYEGSKSNSSYISSYVQNLQYKELKVALTEISDDTFLYIGYTGNSDIYYLEKDIKKVLKKNGLMEKFIYVDATDVINEENVISDISNQLNIVTTKDIVLPAIIYYKDGKPVDYIDSSNQMIDASLFAQLIDKYQLGE